MTSAALSLLPFWHEDSIVLVCTQDALCLCSDGSHQALPWWQGYALVEAVAGREMGTLREFVRGARPLRLPCASFADHVLLAFIRDGLKGGDLVALKVSDQAPAGQKDEVVKQRRLVRKLEAATRGRLDLAGQRYKLTAGPDLGKVAGRDNYEVVGQVAAQQIVAAFANRDGTAPDVKELFLEARGLLAPDWRAPFAPDGLVLLRRLVTLASAGAPSEVITPSQMKKLLKQWIEIEVVDDKGRPYTGRYRLQRPNGGKEEGYLPNGQWSDHDIDPGECRLTLLSPEGGAPVGDDDEDEAGEGWLSLRLVDPDGTPVVPRQYRIEFADGSSREDVWADDELRLDGIPPGECQLRILLGSE